MLFNLILVFCAILNATPIPYKNNKDNQLLRPYNRNDNKNKEKPYLKIMKEDSSELSSESRRLFDWIKKVLNKNVTNANTERNPTYEEILNQRIRFRRIETNLTETLTKLSQVLTQILNIVKYAKYQNYDDIREFLPTVSANNRFKRQLNSSNRTPINVKTQKSIIKKDLDRSSNIHTELETKSLNTHANRSKRNTIDNLDSRNIPETREKRDTAESNKDIAKTTEKPEVVLKLAVIHDNSSVKVEKDSTTEANITPNGRRAMIHQLTSTDDEVKNRLFKYIDEAFSEIVKKIDSLKQIKQMFSKDVSYKVGYIISNIDTLQVNMNNMQRNMDKNKYVWDDKRILNLYDTVKVSNAAVADLLEILKSYVEKSVN